MKSKFPGYFKLTDDERKQLWENATFVLDANILLNLYRYSDETKEDFFRIFEKIQDRIWIPNQAAFEYLNNRLTVISQQEKSYQNAIDSLENIVKEFKNSRQHPFLNDTLLDDFTKLTEKICDELDSNKGFHDRRLKADDILERINALFDDRVGDEFEKETLEKIFKEGKERFLNKIPPGYKDGNKKGNGTNDQNIYGDFIVWKQILNFSINHSKGVILITDDRKEDWWVRFNGKTLGPRPELVKEFKNNSAGDFHMYQSDSFLEYARDFLNENIKESAIEEIRELRKFDELKRRKEIEESERNSKGIIDLKAYNLEDVVKIDANIDKTIKQIENLEFYVAHNDRNDQNKLVNERLIELNKRLKELYSIKEEFSFALDLDFDPKYSKKQSQFLDS